MEFGIILKLLIPIALIGVGIWLRLTEKSEQNKMRKFWFLLIIMGIFLLIFRIIKYT
jgi:hypothetical protein